MTEHTEGPVVVAVGHDPIDLALEFAVDEARRANCGLHLVHAVYVGAQGPEMSLVASTNLELAGKQVVAEALERARDLAGEIPVTTEVRVGGVVPTLVDLAEGARMIVLQRRELSRMRRVVTRSVSGGVAAHARVQVVSVPSDWTPDAKRRDVPSVIVGVDDPERAEEVLAAGLAQARSRGALLYVLHTWEYPDGYEGLGLGPDERRAWTERATAEVQRVIDGLGEATTGVQIEIDARAGHAADALIDLSREADLLVVGRHDPLMPIGSHLGPVARAVLREADCPVLLADPRPRAHGLFGRRVQSPQEVDAQAD